MIEIITEEVKMPELKYRKYQKDESKGKWFVKNILTGEIVFKGKFEDVAIACHNMNKKFYKENFIGEE